MKNKKRGSNAERELFDALWKNGFTVARVAGSGSTSMPSCDLLAAKASKKYAIECKITIDDKKYISKKQISELKTFANGFGLKSIIAVRFFRKGWFFLSPGTMEQKGKSFFISYERAKKVGKTFEQFIN